ncbi:ABC-2 type transport system ATP-binding protein [Pilibacter termitis]|uniref:ABC-2 type transport system ATP-binding protein n=1 Tax=Pilibacter termitis TaxID=263852 RepID=A0A1T4MIQ5_9ENTE|nr:ABC transporter ATP-binding protein [Pilibacter termitis]SJZ66751.1 ABC-2 type transport system ATP-binding protein [Pilibacter termitis]
MITIKGLTFAYHKKTSLKMDAEKFQMNKVYAVLGKNGAGKTTFFKLLTNMLTNYSGDIFIDNKNIIQETEILHEVSIILDDLEVYKDRTGFFNLEYFSRLSGTYDKAKAIALAEQLGIADVLGNKVKSYSLGMRRKLILMIALLKDTKIYIFDEPFRGLDTETVRWMKEAIRELKNSGKCIFISSHVKEDVEDLVDEAIILENGEVKRRVSMEELNESNRIITVNNPEKFSNFLENENIPYETEGGHFILSISAKDLQAMFVQLSEEEIFIEEIKKISALELLEGGKKHESK